MVTPDQPHTVVMFPPLTADCFTQATKGLAAEFGPQGIRVNSICPLLGGTGL